MKTLLAFFSFMMLTSNIFGQSLFFDAIKLAKYSKAEIESLDRNKGALYKSDLNEWEELRLFLEGETDRPFDISVIKKLEKISYKDTNKTLTSLDKTNKLSNYLAPGASLPTEAISTIVKSLTGAKIEQAADALSQVVLDHAKSELYIAYFAKLRTKFEKDSITVCGHSTKLKDIFPHIYKIIADQDVLISPNVGSSMRSAFEEDLKKFPEVALDMIDTCCKTEKNDKYYLLGASVFCIDQIRKGNHPYNVLHNLAQRHVEDSNQFYKSVRLLDCISQSLLDTAQNRMWIDIRQFQQLHKREAEFYLRLLYIHNKTLFDDLDINFINDSEKGRTLLEIVKQSIAYFNLAESHIKTITATIDSLKKSGSKEHLAYANTMLDIVSITNDLITMANEKSNADFQQTIDISRKMINVLDQVDNRMYAEAVLNTLDIIKEFDTNFDTSLPSGFVKYTMLAADIVKADSTEQMKKIIESAILPAGSYRQKRHFKNSVFVNSYVGFTGGSEYTEKNSGGLKSRVQMGAFAPVGIEHAWGSADNKKVGSSNSVFFSLIDLGALVSYRFKNDGKNTSDTVQSLPEFKWQQLVSPGLFYIHGCEKSPISWGFGIQMTPDLVSFQNNSIRKSSFRIGGFLAIDIPLFNLYGTD